MKVATIDANSPTLSADLTELFTRNVAKARRENKKPSARQMAPETKRPIFWIVAGPNGSSKISPYTASDIGNSGSTPATCR